MLGLARWHRSVKDAFDVNNPHHRMFSSFTLYHYCVVVESIFPVSTWRVTNRSYGICIDTTACICDKVSECPRHGFVKCHLPSKLTRSVFLLLRFLGTFWSSIHPLGGARFSIYIYILLLLNGFLFLHGCSLFTSKKNLFHNTYIDHTSIVILQLFIYFLSMSL